MHSHFLRAMPIRGSKSVLIAGRSSLYVAKRALCAFLKGYVTTYGLQLSCMEQPCKLCQVK
jgi:hypothetical protein